MTYLYEELNAPTRLYIKQCDHCGLKYFGKHTGKDIEKYEGSGKVWQRHLKKHNVKPTHLWNSDWYYDTSIIRFATKFSNINNIVESKEWANLVIENGIDGGDTSNFIDYSKVHTPQAGAKRSDTINNQNWIETTGKLKSNKIRLKYSERHSNLTWINEILIPSRNKQAKTMSIKRKEEPYEKKKCEKCGVISDPGNYTKWHGDRCGIKNIMVCPHCLKEGSGGAMKLWHFNNCKNKK